MLKNSKIYGIIIGIILFIISIAGLTYAYITWRSNNIPITVTSDCFTINYIKGQNISNDKLYAINESDFINGNQLTIVDGMELTTISLEIDESCNVSGNSTIMLNTTTLSDAFKGGNSKGALKYKVVEYSSEDYPNVTTDDLNGTTFTIVAEGDITIIESKQIHSMNLTSGNKKEYIIIFYLDEVLVQNDAVGAEFKGTISAEVVQR